MSKGGLKFGGAKVALSGLAVSGGIAIGVPALVLSLGEGLGAGVQTALIILALLGGVLLGVVSAFFGLAIPSSIDEGDDDSPKENGQRAVDVGPAADEPEARSPGDPVHQNARP